ncbi:hypothetical protein RXV86_06455 [Alisedimentitalea sp. MJ-SS2]|uniref:hypothetical protein n=1 Tax=Aliisedimentitalea sp. MJ-SS2 TaxID=3049795 RepID=UPI00290B7E01|nr:hypothetical protein [Alisedimentitalea sp. MJ-SS2]MDU8927019.1 hypothetical protein [Alisedimentitalea sp. MJ-SS2]
MRKVILALVALALPMGAQASTIKTALPGAEMRGAATFRYIGFPLYKAQLFTKFGAPLDWSKDFALELKYLRNLSEYDLVEGTMRELNRTGATLPVRGQLQKCFRHVRKGDRYVAISEGPNQVRFWHNGKRVCTLSHPSIKTRFMSIFLGDNTRSKSFTRKLKGE